MAYKVITGFNYPDDANRNEDNPKAEVRVNAGTILDELPPKYAKGIIELGCVEEIAKETAEGETAAPLPKKEKVSGEISRQKR